MKWWKREVLKYADEMIEKYGYVTARQIVSRWIEDRGNTNHTPTSPKVAGVLRQQYSHLDTREGARFYKTFTDVERNHKSDLPRLYMKAETKKDL